MLGVFERGVELYCNNYTNIFLENSLKKKVILNNIILNNVNLGYYDINNNYKINKFNISVNIDNVFQQLYHAQLNFSYHLIYNINDINCYFNTYNSLTSSGFFKNKPNIYLSDYNFLNYKKKQFINPYTLFSKSYNNEINFLVKQQHKNNNYLDIYIKLKKEKVINLINEQNIKFIECIHTKLPKEWCIEVIKIEKIK